MKECSYESQLAILRLHKDPQFLQQAIYVTDLEASSNEWPLNQMDAEWLLNYGIEKVWAMMEHCRRG